jgi:hypothetical protein
MIHQRLARNIRTFRDGGSDLTFKLVMSDSDKIGAAREQKITPRDDRTKSLVRSIVTICA